MGQGYYFTFDTPQKARRAQSTFFTSVMARFHRRANSLGVTKTTAGKYISGVDVCGPHDTRIDKLAKEIIRRVENGN